MPRSAEPYMYLITLLPCMLWDRNTYRCSMPEYLTSTSIA